MSKTRLKRKDGAKPRVFPRTPSTRKRRGFFDFPGELRNKVYHYYFREGFYVALAGAHASFSPTTSSSTWTSKAKQPDYRALHVSRALGKYTRVEGMQTRWYTSISPLIFVNKQLYAETITFLYMKTTFAFNAPKRVSNFFSTVPKQGSSNITKLHIHYSTYGDPSRSEHRVWQLKHAQSWSTACKTASKKLVCLKELEVWVRFNGGNVWMSLRNDYLEPLWQFRRLARNTNTNAEDHTGSLKPLQLVNVHFESHWSKPDAFHSQNWPVAEASEDLHREFGIAISRAILGWSEEDAMVDAKAAWKHHELWQHHLNFMETGW